MYEDRERAYLEDEASRAFWAGLGVGMGTVLAWGLVIVGLVEVL